MKSVLNLIRIVIATGIGAAAGAIAFQVFMGFRGEGNLPPGGRFDISLFFNIGAVAGGALGFLTSSLGGSGRGRGSGSGDDTDDDAGDFGGYSDSGGGDGGGGGGD